MAADPGATITSDGYNLCTDDGSGFLTATGDLINTDPLLGPLADNGGPACALLPGSPAIDAADAYDSAGGLVEFDQRGVARPQGEFNDIGAFEQVGTGPISALAVSEATVSRDGKTSVVTVVINNPDTETARNAIVTQATLGGMACVERLPVGLGVIKPGKSKALQLTFKDVPSGDATLVIEGTCSLGDFSTTQSVTVP